MAKAGPRNTLEFSYRIADPADHEILIPADRSEDFAYFTIGQPRELRAYYDAYGYVVIRGLVSAKACGRARASMPRSSATAASSTVRPPPIRNGTSSPTTASC